MFRFLGHCINYETQENIVAKHHAAASVLCSLFSRYMTVLSPEVVILLDSCRRSA